MGHNYNGIKIEPIIRLHRIQDSMETARNYPSHQGVRGCRGHTITTPGNNHYAVCQGSYEGVLAQQQQGCQAQDFKMSVIS